MLQSLRRQGWVMTWRCIDELQSNIARAHVRDDLSVLFVQFGNQADARAFLDGLVPLTTSALAYLNEVNS